MINAAICPDIRSKSVLSGRAIIRMFLFNQFALCLNPDKFNDSADIMLLGKMATFSIPRITLNFKMLWPSREW
jgi:hypothetical protein